MSGGAGAAWQPRIIAMVCNWCTYAGADAAGTTRLTYPANVRIVRFPCSGRINPLHVLRAFANGADGVIVSGCHPGDCHYVQGNLVARRRAAVLRALLHFVGVDERRLHFLWVSASEGSKWARLVGEVTGAVRDAGPLASWALAAEPEGAPVLPLPSQPLAPHTPVPEEEWRARTHNLQQLVVGLLERGELGAVIAYAAGSLPDQVVPVVVASGEQAARLVVSEHCFTNLVALLQTVLNRHGRVGVVVKRCDARAVIELLRENQIARDRVTLIGFDCPGCVAHGRLLAKCPGCGGEPPPVCDQVVTAATAEPGPGLDDGGWSDSADPRDEQVAWLEQLPSAERWRFWHDQMGRCLRCYACRAVCPLCYCDTCVADQHRPQWVPTTIDGTGNTVWNLTRALHLAGRCVGCDECTRVCPAGIRLDLINHRLTREVEKRFGHHIGERASDPPVLANFRMDDDEEFIR